MSVNVQCVECGKTELVTPYRSKTYKFCSYSCRGSWRKKHWVGEDHPKWSGGPREKTCQHCGNRFSKRPTSPITVFRKQKFCSKKCADEGGFRYKGNAHYNWHGNPRRTARPSQQKSWATKVISRDIATCTRCGATGIEMHAHHIKSHKGHPELRWDVSNGVTLCYRCHWQEHSAIDENGVNSGKPAADNAGGNPEPSFGRKPIEGVTTRGRAYRRWVGHCDFCEAPLSKRWSDVAGKAHQFCSKSCSAKYQWRHNPPVQGGNASTSALPETDDIV